jgi:hypothetical protein
MVFGRKGQNDGQPPTASEDGREWVKRHVSRNEQPGSIGFAQSLGMKLFDDSYNAMKNERGVRIEDIVAMLASVGGHLALTGVLETLRTEGRQAQDIGMIVLRGNDGNIFYFGDAPNWMLCEAPQSLVSLLFGAAHEHGAAVSIDMLHDEMRLVAQRAGTPQFPELDLPAEHKVDSPLSWARHFAPFVSNAIAPAPDLWAPMVVGFALQQAIDVGRQSLAPMMIARIALSCALRGAKIDPELVAAA